MLNRRSFLSSLPVIAGGIASAQSATAPEKPRHKVERLGIGAIGLRYQGSVITEKARAHGDIVALADVDRHVREQARASFGSTPRIFEDYQQLLQRKDVDVVLIATPDHWHTKMLIDALRAGKDVYCEKPLTLTIDEGKQIREVTKQSKGIVQVGSWQRSDHHFRTAVELVRQGRLGDLQKVDVVLGKNEVGGPFETCPVPKHFNWNLWQGQTPDVPYIPERAHYTFRWWQEYSGGQLTDWGAHHVDIACWAINSTPAEISGSAKYPAIPNGFNVPIDFELQYRFANGVLMTVADHGRNGIMFTGSKGRIFVNRESVSGKPVEDLQDNPLPREEFRLYDFDNLQRPPRTGKLDAIVNHMGNFFDCIAARRTPLSDFEGQHRSISTCHLGNIALKLGRSLKWDGEKEEFPGDPTANALLKREQRAGFQTS
ncbi:MAG: Gfo/Idh/MocA family oxidoreductase [Planctomycetales bacterium]